MVEGKVQVCEFEASLQILTRKKNALLSCLKLAIEEKNADELFQRFKREARVLSKIKHKNVIRGSKGSAFKLF